jgi:hypothetical protein
MLTVGLGLNDHVNQADMKDWKLLATGGTPAGQVQVKVYKPGITPQGKQRPLARESHLPAQLPPMCEPFRIVAYRFYRLRDPNDNELFVPDKNPRYSFYGVPSGSGPKAEIETIDNRFEFEKIDPMLSSEDGERTGKTKSYEDVEQGSWLYVFRQIGEANSKIEWYGVFQLDNKGLVTKMGLASTFNRKTSLQPDKEPKAPKLSLPISASGPTYYYYFYISRACLNASTINEFRDKIASYNKYHDVIPKVNLETELKELKDDSGTPLLCVLDPITIALNLKDIYHRCLDERLDYCIPHKKLSSTQLELTKKRIMKKALADILEMLPKYDLDIDDELVKRNGEFAYSSFLNKYKNEMEVLESQVSTHASNLVDWITRPGPFQFASKSHDVSSTERAKFIEYFARITGRLAESDDGQRCLGHHCLPLSAAEQQEKGTKYFVQKCVMPLEQSDAKEWVEASRKSWAAFLEIFQTHAPFIFHGKVVEELLEQEVKSSIDEFAKRLNEHLGATIFESVREDHSVEFKARAGKSVNKQVAFYEIKLTKIGESGSESWMTEVKDIGDEMKAIRFVSAVQLLIEVINLYYAGMTLKNAFKDSKDVGIALIGALGSVADFASAVAITKVISEGTRRFIGCIGAICDMIVSAKEGFSLWGEGDKGAAIGKGMIFLGSGIVAGMLSFGVVAPPLMILAVLVIAAGTILSWLGKSTPIEKIASHCYFGEKYGKNHDAPDWAAVKIRGRPGSDTGPNFRFWVNDLHAQLQGFYSLLCAINVGAVQGFWSEDNMPFLDIRYGMTLPTSQFHIQYHQGSTNLGEVIIDIASESIHKISPKLYVELLSFGMYEGRSYLELRVKNRDDMQYDKDISYDIQLWLDKKGEYGVPRSPMRYKFAESGELNTEEVSNYE